MIFWCNDLNLDVFHKLCKFSYWNGTCLIESILFELSLRDMYHIINIIWQMHAEFQWKNDDRKVCYRWVTNHDVDFQFQDCYGKCILYFYSQNWCSVVKNDYITYIPMLCEEWKMRRLDSVWGSSSSFVFHYSMPRLNFARTLSLNAFTYKKLIYIYIYI